MDNLIVQGNLNELKGQIKQTWGRLSDNDLERLEGAGDELVGKIQKAYGYTREKAQQEFDKFKASNPQIFRDNRGRTNQETHMASTQFGGQMDSSSIKSRASHLVEDNIVDPAQQYLKKAREYGSQAVDRGSEIVRDNPGYSILGATAVGFLMGAYFARRRN